MAAVPIADRAERAVRAYAYLTASFRAANDVTDVLDCIVPFVAKVALKDRSQPVDVSQVAKALEDYGLRIPRYAVQQLLPRLQKQGLLEWNTVAKAYLPVRSKIDEEATDISLSEDFQYIESGISLFANSLDLAKTPFSPSWSEALIRFLQSDSLRSGMKPVVHKKAIISEFSEIENYVIARYIQSVSHTDTALFESISRIYSGVLIEDFVSNIQSIGNPAQYKGLKVYYDTSVMLRLLGCSGRELETATLEMHTSLIELGCDLHYFDVNRTEVSGILESIINANAHGFEIFGETGEAIIAGDISVGELRDLAATFETRLGHLNVFPIDYNYSARKMEDAFQIGEIDFTDALVSAALKSDKAYKRENALNDARAVALILRLRRGKISRELSGCKHIFVSQNSLLQRTARRFCSDHVQEYDISAITPVITVGQLTTAGWLATERVLEQHKVSKELLANCFSAVKPSAAWAEEFAHALEQFSEEDRSVLEERADAALILKATRDTVRDQSLNEAAVLRKMNVAEIFRLTASKGSATEAAHQSELETLRQQHDKQLTSSIAQREEELQAERHNAVTTAAEEASKRASQLQDELRSGRNELRSHQFAARATTFFTLLLFASLAILVISDKWNPFQESSLGSKVVTFLIVAASLIGAADLCGLRPVTRFIDSIRAKIAITVYRFLQGDEVY
ncbi:hypothetical protein [Sphingomonas faeni]|uniref:hypothetical protein n=1 Tax=Sphingomonas faeni TaxID=185950 RepID=UPI0033598CC4